jgi:hypothetical protein
MIEIMAKQAGDRRGIQLLFMVHLPLIPSGRLAERRV